MEVQENLVGKGQLFIEGSQRELPGEWGDLREGSHRGSLQQTEVRMSPGEGNDTPEGGQ